MIYASVVTGSVRQGSRISVLLNLITFLTVESKEPRVCALALADTRTNLSGDGRGDCSPGTKPAHVKRPCLFLY